MASQDAEQGTYNWGECQCFELSQTLGQHEGSLYMSVVLVLSDIVVILPSM